MKKISVLILLLGLFAGCRTIKTVEKLYDKQKDSISYVERVIIDTLKIKGDSIKFELPCDQLKPQSFAQGRAKAKAEPKGNGYTIVVRCDSIEKLLVNKEKEIIRLSDKIKSLDKKQTKGLTAMQAFWVACGKILTTLLVLTIGFKFF